MFTRTRSRVIAGLAAAGALAAVLTVAAPAAGLGSGVRQCYNNLYVYGDSASSGAATSVTNGSTNCDRAMARVYTAAGWSPYSYSWTVAWRPAPGGSGALLGGHSVAWPAPSYLINFPFTT